MEEITAKDFAMMKNRSESWGARLAKNSAIIQKNPFPRKKGRYWFATYEEWEKALAMAGWRMRTTKPRKHRKE